MKKLLLSAVVLLSVGLNAQETGGVGINTENPQATLDVNGDARLQKVELMTTSTPTEEIFSDCPCVLTIDKYGVIKRIPKEKFVLTDGSTNSGTPPATTTYSATKSYTATGTYKNQNCGSGKVAEDYPVSHTETVTLTSDVSQDDADKKALDEATRLASEWVIANGQQEANEKGTCVNKPTPSVGTRLCEKGRPGSYVLRSQRLYKRYDSNKSYLTPIDKDDTTWCTDDPKSSWEFPYGSALKSADGKYFICRETSWGTYYEIWWRLAELEPCDD